MSSSGSGQNTILVLSKFLLKFTKIHKVFSILYHVQKKLAELEAHNLDEFIRIWAEYNDPNAE